MERDEQSCIAEYITALTARTTINLYLNPTMARDIECLRLSDSCRRRTYANTLGEQKTCSSRQQAVRKAGLQLHRANDGNGIHAFVR